MAEYQGGGSAVVVAEIGVHVRPADADGLHPDQMIAVCGYRLRHITNLKCFDPFVNQCFHFAVNPPSTISVCSVT